MHSSGKSTPQTRFEGGSLRSGQYGIQYSRLCARPEDTLYAWSFWQVPMQVHERTQVFPYAQVLDEARPRELNS